MFMISTELALMKEKKGKNNWKRGCKIVELNLELELIIETKPHRWIKEFQSLKSQINTDDVHLMEYGILSCLKKLQTWQSESLAQLKAADLSAPIWQSPLWALETFRQVPENPIKWFNQTMNFCYVAFVEVCSSAWKRVLLVVERIRHQEKIIHRVSTHAKNNWYIKSCRFQLRSNV